MKKNLWVSLAVTASFLTPALVAQDRPIVVRRAGTNQAEASSEIVTEDIIGSESGDVLRRVEIHRKAGIAPQNFTFVSGMVNGPTVTGAPYSAEAVTESIQTLADGNRIINRSTAMLYRDGEGRERREEGDPLKTVTITDPVAHLSYSLFEEQRLATKQNAVNWINVQPKQFQENGEATVAGGGRLEVATDGSVQGELNFQDFYFVGTPSAKTATGLQHLVTTATNTYHTALTLDGEAENVEEKVEDLGTRNMEGVAAQGSRTTMIIPAGAIGNERAIEIVDERWFSPELKTTVMTRHSDPRSGEVTYRLRNIRQVEPAPNLFEVPPGFEIIDSNAVAMKQELELIQTKAAEENNR